MDIARKIARIIFPHYRFGETKIDDAIKLVKLGVGGFCLYGGSVDEVVEAVRVLRSYSDHPLLFAGDFENGVGQWVSGATKLPPNMAICASGDISIARRKAEITAIEADSLGVDWVFAPVVDIADNHSNPIVNIRAFSDNIESIVDFARSYISGLNSFNILNSIKHFPGHGSTSVDSHLVLPELNKSFNDIYNFEMHPFRCLLDVCDCVMVGHIKVTSIDNLNPASVSKKFISDILRDKLNYHGVVITDALMMKAINDDIDAGVKAFMAGADILLYPNDPYKLYETLLSRYSKGEISESQIDLSLKRLDKLIYKRMVSNYRTKDLGVIGSKEHKAFVSNISSKCISWVKEEKWIKGKIFYFELPHTQSVKGNVFIDELKKLGIRIVDCVSDCDVIVVGIFSKPKAFSGSINLIDSEKKKIDEMISTGKKIIMVSFGSPFVFDGYINKVDGLLSCFCDLEEFQITAARAICGGKVYGRMPVRIDE